MNKRSRILALFLALLLTAQTFAGCSEGTDTRETDASSPSQDTVDETKAQTEAEAETEPPYDGLEAENFGGITFTILNREKSPTYNAHPNPEIEAEEQTGETLNDSIYDRNLILEEKYQIDLASVTFAQHADINTELERDIAAGDKTYDVVFPNISTGFQMATNGILYELSEIPHLQTDKEWWWANIAESTSVAGKNFFISGDMNIGAMNSAGLIYMNKKLMEDHHLESPYAIVDEGKWTLDAMAKLSAKVTEDLNGDGIYDQTDKYGTVSSSFGWQPLFYGSGQLLIPKDEEGMPYLDAGSEQNYDHISNVIGFLNDKTTTFNVNHATGVSNLGQLTVDMFYHDQALFFVEVMYGVPQFREMESDFGLLPLPKATEAQQNYSTYLGGNATTVAIPISNTELDRTGKIVEDMAFYSSKHIRPAFYEIMLKSKYARDEDTARMLDVILSNFTIDLTLVIPNIGIDGLMRTAATNGTTDILSQIAANKKLYTAILNKTVKAINKEINEAE